MPTRPKKQHTYPKTEASGFTAPDYHSRPEYHTARWTWRRKAFLEQPEHVFCVRCKKQGIYKLAKVVDHIIPAEICGDFWDESNWQALCKRCNAVKAAEDKVLIQQHRKGVGGSNLYGRPSQDPAPSFENTHASFQLFEKEGSHGQ
ncbi:MAG: HNH endonuclease [Bacteroidales bacterium]|nr:HNH endonuclease [Bacteroidales bacterium]